jgi:hypothetical protein
MERIYIHLMSVPALIECHAIVTVQNRASLVDVCRALLKTALGVSRRRISSRGVGRATLDPELKSGVRLLILGVVEDKVPDLLGRIRLLAKLAPVRIGEDVS